MGSRNQGQSTMFRVARDDAERQICDKLKCKLDEFLELENYDWLLVEPKGHASSFITDLIAFLQSIFLSFTNLPVSMPLSYKYLIQNFNEEGCDLNLTNYCHNFHLSMTSN